LLLLTVGRRLDEVGPALVAAALEAGAEEELDDLRATPAPRTRPPMHSTLASL
jgi:hypothetical protein